jgi:hypothetical protein
MIRNVTLNFFPARVLGFCGPTRSSTVAESQKRPPLFVWWFAFEIGLVATLLLCLEPRNHKSFHPFEQRLSCRMCFGLNMRLHFPYCLIQYVDTWRFFCGLGLFGWELVRHLAI